MGPPLRKRKAGLGRRRKATDKLLPADLEAIARMALEGLSAPKIRAAINAGKPLERQVSESAIYHRIARLDAEYLARMSEAVAARIAKLHARAEHALALAFDAFRRSQRADPMKILNQDGTPKGYEDGPGDPRFLFAAIAVMDRQAKLLGSDKQPDAPPAFIGNPLRLPAEMTLEQAAAINAMNGAELLDMAARCQAELLAAKVQVERAALGKGEDGEPN